MPLQEVQNKSPSKTTLQMAASTAFFQPSTALSSPKKENSPMTSPNRSGIQTPKGKPAANKNVHRNKKASQQNSKEPTPIGTPKRPRAERMSTSETLKEHSELPLDEYVTQRLMAAPLRDLAQDTNQATPGDSGQQQSKSKSKKPREHAPNVGPLSTEGIPPADDVPKAKSKPKNKSNRNAKAPSVDGSSTTVSPVDENSSFAGMASTNTSFSTPSSRQPSAAPASRKPKQSNSSVSLNTAASNEDKKKKPAHERQASAPNESKEKKARPEGQPAPKVKNTQHKGNKNRNGAANPNATLGHSKNQSNSSMMSNSSQRKTDAARTTEEHISRASSTLIDSGANKENSQEKIVVAPSSTVKVKVNAADRRPTPIVIPSSNTNVVDSASSSPSHMSHTPKSAPEHLLTPRVSDANKSGQQDEQLLTPSKPSTPLPLGRTSSMQSLIKSVNEKSPDTKKSAKSAFVAVPRSFESSRSPASKPHFRPPTEDEQGSATWPFVRRFRAR